MDPWSMIKKWGKSRSNSDLSYLTLGKFTSPKGKKIFRILGFSLGFKSDENNILRLAIHLFSNRPIYYLLFD